MPCLGSHDPTIAIYAQRIGTFAQMIGTYALTIGSYAQTTGTYAQMIGAHDAFYAIIFLPWHTRNSTQNFGESSRGNFEVSNLQHDNPYDRAQAHHTKPLHAFSRGLVWRGELACTCVEKGAASKASQTCNDPHAVQTRFYFSTLIPLGAILFAIIIWLLPRRNLSYNLGESPRNSFGISSRNMTNHMMSRKHMIPNHGMPCQPCYLGLSRRAKARTCVEKGAASKP